MEDIVRQAMARWPNVPDCYGWLGLDARGDWYLRDEQAQACGAFAGGDPAARGSRLLHEALLAFIGRNYEADARGCWFFQNGPQRVFVELEAAPWVWRVDDGGTIHAHTGQAATLHEALLDEAGRVYLATNLGFGLVHTQDVARVAEWIDVAPAQWKLQSVSGRTLPERFGFVLSPHALQA